MKEVFVLRKSPTRTEAFLAANRHSAPKCTGPCTLEGNALVSVNALNDGRCATRLPEKLETAGYRSAAGLYSQIRSEIGATFRVEAPLETKPMERAAALAWLMAWRAGVIGHKPQSSLFSVVYTPLSLLLSPTRFRIVNRWLRFGMVYWVRRKRYHGLETVSVA